MITQEQRNKIFELAESLEKRLREEVSKNSSVSVIPQPKRSHDLENYCVQLLVDGDEVNYLVTLTEDSADFIRVFV